MRPHQSKDLSYFYSFKAKLTQIEIKAQTEAAVKVAEYKYTDIKNKSDKEIIAKRISVFIDTCGKILYDLQAKTELSSLKSDEKGVFTVSFKDDESGEKLSSFLKTAADDTIIKIINEDNKNDLNIIDFELSRLFSPKYKFLFRSSGGKIKLDESLLKDLCTNGKDSFENTSHKLIEHTENMYTLDASMDYKSKTYQKKLI